MKNYKALILDLDGTTLPSRRDAMPSVTVIKAIGDARQVVKVAIATGRPFYLADHVFKILGIDQPCIVDGGAEIINPATKQLLFKRYLTIDKQKEVFRICKHFGINVVSSETKYDSDIRSEAEIKNEAAKLFIGGLPEDRAIALMQELEAVEGIAPHFASSWSAGKVIDIHVTDVEGTKKQGVEELIKILNVKPEDVIGVGDHHNDLPMLEAVGLKVAMGNAPEEVKMIADYIAPSLEEDGVAEVIKKFIL